MNFARMNLVISVVLGALILAMLAKLSLRHDLQIDWTANARNTLTASSVSLLASMPDTITATAYVYANTETHREINARFAPYQRLRSDFKLHFVDPNADPQTVRELGIDQSGEVVIEYQGRRENLTSLSEPEITAALQRLSYAEQARILFVTGHGERDPQALDQSGYSQLSQILLNKGLKLSTFSLAIAAIPENTDLLVLAAPQRALLEGEIQRLQAYLASGGNLLWLTDPKLPLLPTLAASLGLQQHDGHVIYQDYELLGSGHPALALIAEYPRNPVTGKLAELSAFALAAGYSLAQNSDYPAPHWKLQPILSSVDRSWLETGPLEGDLVYSPGEDRLGPIDIGYAMQRKLSAESDQRVIAIADSDFLSNGYLGQLGNRPLAVAIFQWLIQRDAQIQIDLPPAPDRQLQLSPLATNVIALGFVLVLPLGFFITGLLRWWLRQRRR